MNCPTYILSIINSFGIRCDEQILRLDVSVDDIVPVAEGDSFDHLVDVLSESLGLVFKS
jgi:hypothetical protein